MMPHLNKPIEQIFVPLWKRIPLAYRRAVPWIIAIGVLAYGFDMTNLNLHHDDVSEFFLTDRIGHPLGRFGYSWINYYIQRDYYVPFLEVFLGILALAVSGLCVAASWRVQRSVDVVLISGVLVCFPYMAQIYTYKTCLFPFSLAHALVALAILLCSRFSIQRYLLAAVLLGFSFSIYQSVINNAIAIICFSTVTALITENKSPSLREVLVRSFAIPASCIVIGGVLYLGLVAIIGIPTDTYQNADKAFSLSNRIDLLTAFQLVVHGTRSFLYWPENYFPFDVKATQLAIAGAATVAILIQRVNIRFKLIALLFASFGLLAPRVLQIVHEAGTFHNLTLTAYGVAVAASLMLALRIRLNVLRNVICAVSVVLIFEYLMLSNWMATVNYLNMEAHKSILTQILTRIGNFPASSVSQPQVAIVGKLELSRAYPFLPETGIATDYIDLQHLAKFASIMRQPTNFIGTDQTSENVRELARHVPIWPAPGSVFVADGLVVVVLSRED